MQSILYLSFAMIGGLALSRLMKKVHLPNVTGYLIAGLLIGPFVLHLIPKDAISSLDTITMVALGFIAFSIGGEFRFSNIKAIGAKSITITLFQSLGTAILVDTVLILCGFDIPLALTLGAIATATAPAATLMVVRQYHAKGPVTNTLLPVVAMDDAVGLMVYSISVSVAQALCGGSLSFSATVLKPLLEIVLSLAVGIVIGLAVSFVMRFFHSKSNRMMISIAAVSLGVALARTYNLSDLLLCMAIGATYVNLRDDAMETLDSIDAWTPPLFMLFFVISGADLDVSILPSVGILGVLYLLARSAGKYFGALLGAVVTKADPNIRKYLGLTLLPQAGVAIGMAQTAVSALPAYGANIRAVVLCATLIYELVGPVITKICLTKAGEITPEPKRAKAVH